MSLAISVYQSRINIDIVTSVFGEIEQSPWQMPRAFVFAEVVGAGSITAAASRLGLSKSAVSTQLKELEQFVGTQLIERTTRTQRLTEAGRAFLPHVNAMMEAWRSGLRGVKATLAEPVGVLRLTAPSYLYPAGVGQAVAAFGKSYPNVLIQAHASDQVQPVGDGEFDLAVRVAAKLDNPRLHAAALGFDEDIVVAAPSVAQELRAATRPEQLAAARWIMHAELPATRTFEGRGRETVELTLPRHVIAGSGLAMRALAREGAGVAIVLGTIAREDLDSGRLVRLVPDWHCGVRSLFAVCRPAEMSLPKISRFVATLRDELDTRP